jgi:hypothetical protein
MATADLIATAKTQFPNLQIKYKNQDPFMKFLGKLLFFSPSFMTTFVTTIGDTVYLPTEQTLINTPDVFIHECVHMYDEKRIGFFYYLGYLLPQLLAPLVLLLLFVTHWWIVLPLALLMLAPLPAPLRAFFEKKAYFVQLYAISKLGRDPSTAAPQFVNWIRDGAYYWMWPFEQNSSFAQEMINIQMGTPSWSNDSALLQMVNDLITATLK